MASYTVNISGGSNDTNLVIGSASGSIADGEPNVAGAVTSASLTSAVAPLATSVGLTSAVAPLATSAGLTSAVAPLATSASQSSLATSIGEIQTLLQNNLLASVGGFENANPDSPHGLTLNNDISYSNQIIDGYGLALHRRPTQAEYDQAVTDLSNGTEYGLDEFYRNLVRKPEWATKRGLDKLNAAIDLSDQLCVVLGGSHGFGWCTALELLKRGAHVLCTGRTKKLFNVQKLCAAAPDVASAMNRYIGYIGDVSMTSALLQNLTFVESDIRSKTDVSNLWQGTVKTKLSNDNLKLGPCIVQGGELQAIGDINGLTFDDYDDANTPQIDISYTGISQGGRFWSNTTGVKNVNNLINVKIHGNKLNTDEIIKLSKDATVAKGDNFKIVLAMSSATLNNHGSTLAKTLGRGSKNMFMGELELNSEIPSILVCPNICMHMSPSVDDPFFVAFGAAGFAPNDWWGRNSRFYVGTDTSSNKVEVDAVSDDVSGLSIRLNKANVLGIQNNCKNFTGYPNNLLTDIENSVDPDDASYVRLTGKQFSDFTTKMKYFVGGVVGTGDTSVARDVVETGKMYTAAAIDNDYNNYVLHGTQTEDIYSGINSNVVVPAPAHPTAASAFASAFNFPAGGTYYNETNKIARNREKIILATEWGQLGGSQIYSFDITHGQYAPAIGAFMGKLLDGSGVDVATAVAGTKIFKKTGVANTKLKCIL